MFYNIIKPLYITLEKKTKNSNIYIIVKKSTQQKNNQKQKKMTNMIIKYINDSYLAPIP